MMGEQVIFDPTLKRILQPKSCDQCFLRKNKCSRHAPCSTCSAHRRRCTYDRQSQYRRRPSCINVQSLPNVNQLSNPTREDIVSANATGESSLGLEFQSFDAAAIGDADQLSGGTFALLNEGTNFNDLTWTSLDVSTIEGSSNRMSRVFECFSPTDNDLQEFTGRPWPIERPLRERSTQGDNQLLSLAVPDDIWQLTYLFLDRLHASMPFFKREYLIDNIYSKRYLYDRSFNALIHSISALAIFQTTQKLPGHARPLSQIEKAESLLAEAVRLHSYSDFGENPVLEHVLTSVFLFGCQFCKGNHYAARFRLREAVTLAETMGLDDPQTYRHLDGEEMDRRLRTFLCLTVIHRVYAIQRDHPLNEYLLTSKRLHRVQEMVEQVSIGTDQLEVSGIRGICHMVDLIDFVDVTFVNCWRGRCWDDAAAHHVSSETVSRLLQRYTVSVNPQIWPNDTQRADILVTRHWICHILWELGKRHGFVNEGSSVVQMRPDYALTIARDSIKTSESFNMACLEYHGVGMVEKLYDIASNAIRVVKNHEAATLGDVPSTSPADLGLAPESPRLDGTQRSTVDGSWNPDLASTSTALSLDDFANRFLAIFAKFRGGKHPYLMPYMRMLCETDSK
ncbi:hypothetical protein DPSP01_010624 [Paraphaeosphaeria sporulosa]